MTTPKMIALTVILVVALISTIIISYFYFMDWLKVHKHKKKKK